jgi:DNA-binding transcriptional LysR family regulator
MDRLTSLMVFTRVVESGGFSAAARRLNMSVTMASKHVQALEERLGARLLNRTTRKVSLTEIGKAYYERSVQILADLDEADRTAGMLHSIPRGRLKLHVGTHISRYVAPVIAEYLRRYPETTAEITTGETMVDLVDGEFDLAVRATPPPNSSYTLKKLTPWRHIVCCAPSYLAGRAAPRHPADLAYHECLRYAFYPFGSEWRFDGPDGPVGVTVSGKVVTNGAEILRSMAIAGDGIFLGPSFMVAEDIRAGSLLKLLPDYNPLEFMITAIYPHKYGLSSKVRSFIQLLLEHFAVHRSWMSEVSADPSELAHSQIDGDFASESERGLV